MKLTKPLYFLWKKSVKHKIHSLMSENVRYEVAGNIMLTSLDNLDNFYEESGFLGAVRALNYYLDYDKFPPLPSN